MNKDEEVEGNYVICNEKLASTHLSQKKFYRLNQRKNIILCLILGIIGKL